MLLSDRKLQSFAAIDFETATSKRSSACALGLVIVDSGRIAAERKWLIRPPGNEYHWFNTKIHSIRAVDTEDAASFSQVWSEASEIAHRYLLVAHNAAFDMSVLRQSAAHYNYKLAQTSYLCTYRLARSRWPNGYSWKLPDICKKLGIDGLEHHDPLSDARAAARVLLAMCTQDDCSIEELCNKLNCRFGVLRATFHSRSSRRSRTPQGDPTMLNVEADGQLSGKRLAFTGRLDSMTREDAFQVTRESGGMPSTTVSLQTDYLVVGMTDYATVGTDGMSNKMRKAVNLSKDGGKIEIIDEDDFLRLAAAEALNF